MIVLKNDAIKEMEDFIVNKTNNIKILQEKIQKKTIEDLELKNKIKSIDESKKKNLFNT